MPNIDARRIHDAFSPSKEILDPKYFVGRSDEIRKAINALLNAGSFIAIFGLRGVGKSSIANQIKLIAEGNKTLPISLGLSRSLPIKSFDFIVHRVTSDGFITNIADLIKRIVFGDEANPSLFSLTESGEKQLAEFKRTVTAEGSVGVFGAKVGAKGKEESKYKTYISDDMIQQFRSLLGTIKKDNQSKEGLLILVDEFDTIPDKSGFASLVKACSSEFIRFGVVGIGANVTELLKDHSSISRQIDFIDVPLMPMAERLQILSRAEQKIGNDIKFSESARNEICTKSEGFPYFVHLLGKEAMLLTHERLAREVNMDDIRLLSQNISNGRLTNTFESVYHESVKNSPQREILLKLFAESPENEIQSEKNLRRC